MFGKSARVDLIQACQEGKWTGLDKDDRKQNIAWKFSYAYPLGRTSGLKVSYIGTRTQEDTGFDSETLAAALSIAWQKNGDSDLLQGKQGRYRQQRDRHGKDLQRYPHFDKIIETVATRPQHQRIHGRGHGGGESRGCGNRHGHEDRVG